MENEIGLKLFYKFLFFQWPTVVCDKTEVCIYIGKRDQINESECNNMRKNSVLLNVTILVTTLVWI